MVLLLLFFMMVFVALVNQIYYFLLSVAFNLAVTRECPAILDMPAHGTNQIRVLNLIVKQPYKCASCEVTACNLI